MLFRSALLDVKPFRTGLGDHDDRPDGHARRRARRRRRQRPRRRSRQAARWHRLRPARPDRTARGRAPALRRLVRRRPPPFASRGPCVRSHGRSGRRATRCSHRRPRSRTTSRRSTSSTTTPTSSPRGCPSRRRCSSTPNEETEEQAALFDVPRAEGAYVLPDRAVLKVSPPAGSSSKGADQRTADTLVTALAHFGVEATIVGQIAGPRVTRYELQLAPGTKVSKVATLKDDLSYALATTEIRILAPIPGKQAVGVEVPNLTPNIVTLGDIYDDLPSSASPLAVWLGKDIAGNAVWADLARMPHILIAGTTGSGKSGCINTHPDLDPAPLDARRGADDPDRPEAGRAQLLRVDPAPADAGRLEPEGGAQRCCTNLVAEMERRYERLSIVRARNLPEAEPRASSARGEDTLPYLLVVIDELADLMMITPAGGRGRDHPPGAEVARRRHPPRAGDAAAVGRRDHRHDQGQRAVPDRLRGLEPDRLARDPRRRRRREPARPGRHALQAARHARASSASRAPTSPRRRSRSSSSSAATSASRSSTRRCSSCPRAPSTTTATTTASSTRTRIRCSTRRSRSSSRRRPPPCQPAPAPPAGRLHARRPADRHARAARDHLRLRGIEAAAGARRRSGARALRHQQFVKVRKDFPFRPT